MELSHAIFITREGHTYLALCFRESAQHHLKIVSDVTEIKGKRYWAFIYLTISLWSGIWHNIWIVLTPTNWYTLPTSNFMWAISLSFIPHSPLLMNSLSTNCWSSSSLNRKNYFSLIVVYANIQDVSLMNGGKHTVGGNQAQEPHHNPQIVDRPYQV